MQAGLFIASCHRSRDRTIGWDLDTDPRSGWSRQKPGKGYRRALSALWRKQHGKVLPEPGKTVINEPSSGTAHADIPWLRSGECTCSHTLTDSVLMHGIGTTQDPGLPKKGPAKRRIAQPPFACSAGESADGRSFRSCSGPRAGSYGEITPLQFRLCSDCREGKSPLSLVLQKRGNMALSRGFPALSV